MKYSEVPAQILEICRDETQSFRNGCDCVSHLLDHVPTSDLLEHLDHAGVIPESFPQGSREEKLFSKYCDSLFAACLRVLGMQATVVPERSNSADVEASFANYRLVGDLKAFRLSRTANNPKDSKVGALAKWRVGAEYACLVAPLYRYPTTSGQIYEQAIEHKVTLLSYAHFAFLLRHPPRPQRLRELWRVDAALRPTNKADAYWDHVEKVVCAITKSSRATLKKAVFDEHERLGRIAEEQINFLEREKTRISQLSKTAAISELIAEKRLDGKIEMIRKTAGLQAV